MVKATFDSVLVARHAETESNLRQRYAGLSNEPLTERGRDQALRMGSLLRGRGVGRIRASCVARAVETGALVAGTLGVPIVLDDRLNEIRMGPWEGLTQDEVAERFPKEYRLWLERPDKLKLFGRETLDDVGSRVRSVLADSANSGVRELLLTHVALVRCAILVTNSRPMAEYKSIDIPNCHVVEIPTLGVQGAGAATSSRQALDEPIRRYASR